MKAEEPFIDSQHKWITVAPGLFWQAGVRLAPELRTGDALVVTGNPRFLSNYHLILQAKLKGVAVLWWGHGWTPGSTRIRMSVRLRIMRIADAIILYTDREVDALRSLGFPGDRLFALNNGLDTDAIDQAIKKWKGVRLRTFAEEKGLDKMRLVLFSGRITAKARLDRLIGALKVMRDRHPNITLAIIGDGPERPALRALTQSLRLDNAIHWAGAVYEEDALAPWFLLATCFVYPGSVGLSLLHAMSYGVPPVVHDNAANQMPEYAAVSPGITGLVFDERSDADLVEQISSLISDSSLRNALSEAAFDTTRRNYNVRSMVGRFVAAVHAASSMVRAPAA